MRITVAALSFCLLAAPALAKSKNEVVIPLKTSAGEDAGTATFEPGLARWSPLMITRSSPLIPSTARSRPNSAPSFTGRSSTVSSALARRTNFKS